MLGANDSLGETVAVLTCLPGLFIASVLAFWKRKIAGATMLALPVIFVLGMLDERRYTFTISQVPQEVLLAYLWEILRPCLPVLLLGAFAFLTGMSGWPEVIGNRPKPGEEDGSPPIL